jgi:hypothetical protein
MCAFLVDGGAGALWYRPAQHWQRACRLGIGGFGGSANRHDRPESDRHCARRRWQRHARHRQRQRAIVNRNRQLALFVRLGLGRRQARFKRRRDISIAAAPMPRRQPAIKRLRLNLHFRIAAGARQNDQCALGNVDRTVHLATPRQRIGSHQSVRKKCFSEHLRRICGIFTMVKKSLKTSHKNSEKKNSKPSVRATRSAMDCNDSSTLASNRRSARRSARVQTAAKKSNVDAVAAVSKQQASRCATITIASNKRRLSSRAFSRQRRSATCTPRCSRSESESNNDNVVPDARASSWIRFASSISISATVTATATRSRLCT